MPKLHLSAPSRQDHIDAFATIMLSEYISYGNTSSLVSGLKGTHRINVQLLSLRPQLQFMTDKQLRKIVELSMESKISLEEYLSNLRHETSMVQVLEMEDYWVHAPNGLIVGTIHKSPTYSFWGGIDYDGSVNS